MANERVATQRGREIEDETTVLIGGQVFSGWQRVSITKNLESIANGISIDLFDKFEALKEAWPFRPGVNTKVNIGTERVITGKMEAVQVSYTDERRGYTVLGRSNAGDLVDCSHTGPNEFKNISLTNLARELVKPFGLKVFESVIPDVIPTFAVKPGETVFEALDRAARLQGLFFISTRAGNIRLTRAARARANTSLEQSVNILSAVANYDDSKRHNEYIVKAQTIGLPDFNGLNVSQPEGRALDLGVTRHRPLILISESNADSAKAQTRAQWEASVRLAKAVRIDVTVQGWTQNDGSLWGINQIVRTKSTFLGINQDLLSIRVVHVDGTEEGKTTTITLTDKRAYNPEPVKSQNEDIFAALGAEFA